MREMANRKIRSGWAKTGSRGVNAMKAGLLSDANCAAVP